MEDKYMKFEIAQKAVRKSEGCSVGFVDLLNKEMEQLTKETIIDELVFFIENLNFYSSEECGKCRKYQYDECDDKCFARKMAEELINKFQLKLHENLVVITKKEYDKLLARPLDVMGELVSSKIKLGDDCKYYDKLNRRCNGAKFAPGCYCDGKESKCSEYPETRKKFNKEIGDDE